MKFRILDSSRITIIIFILITLLFIFISLLNIYEAFSWDGMPDQIPEYLKHKSKSFDAESEMIRRCGIDGAWKSNPTSCFDCETSAVDQADGDIRGGFLAKSIKYY